MYPVKQAFQGIAGTAEVIPRAAPALGGSACPGMGHFFTVASHCWWSAAALLNSR